MTVKTLVHAERTLALEQCERVKALVVPQAYAVAHKVGEATVIIAPGAQGPPGKTGEIGPAGGTAFERTAGEALSALKAVWEDESGAVYALDYADDEHIDMLAGLTITAASEGAPITIQRSGPLDATGLNLTAGRVWLGENGALTQSPPDDGFDVLVGYATAEQRLYIDFSDNILLTIED